MATKKKKKAKQTTSSIWNHAYTQNDQSGTLILKPKGSTSLPGSSPIAKNVAVTSSTVSGKKFKTLSIED